MLDQIAKAGHVITGLMVLHAEIVRAEAKKVALQKEKTNKSINELESLINSKKEKLIKALYLSSKSKLSSFKSAITRYKDTESLKSLQKEIDRLASELKSR